jgi:GTPase SAR1 family protein
MTVLDTGGHQEYINFRDQWCQQAQAFIIVFSATSRSSFNAVHQFSKAIAKCPTRYPLALVATKTDLKPEVPYEEGLQRARDLNAQYFHISVKNCDEAETPFQYLGRQWLHVDARHTQLQKSAVSDVITPPSRNIRTAMGGRLWQWISFILSPCIGRRNVKAQTGFQMVQEGC